MSEQPNTQPADELGAPMGPQGAAQAALGVEIDGHEPPPGADGAAQPGPDAETWETLLRTGIGAIFTALGSRWKPMQMTPEEVDTLAKAWAPVAEKHAGAAVPMEYIAIGATLIIVGPKVAVTFAEVKQARREAAARRPPSPPERGTTVV
jgi:hypothetical protein